MNLNKILQTIEFEVIEMFRNDRTSHDFNHLKRVKNVALKIQQQEGGNEIVIGVSAMLHDVHRLMSEEQSRYITPKESLEVIKKVLVKTDLNKEIVSNILHCIEFHEEYGFSSVGKTVNDIETLILQDADNLDAIGAIGIARVHSFGGTIKSPIWIPEIPFDRPVFDEGKTDPSDIHNFYSKLLKLKDNMNTNYGRKIAEHRHKFMEKYLDEFFAEWNGVK